MIIHCMKESLWNERRYEVSWGHEEIERSGYIHCSTIEYFHRVAPNFSKDERYVLLAIDESKLISEVIYEDDSNTGRLYPHVYGLINNSAVVLVLPLLRDENGNYIKNVEFKDFIEK